MLQRQLDAVKKDKQELQKVLDNCQITGAIAASVRSGLMFYAELNLIAKMAKLDTGGSKYIVSQSNEKTFGGKAYEHGQPITSLKQKTVDFAGKAGKYYIRAYVVDSRGMAVELASNPVTTKGSGLSFGYEGKAAIFVLAGGRYRLEVWGAQGGKSVSPKNARQGDGGLGGYSKGTLSLPKGAQVYVYVGGHGKTANPSDGAETSGSFPDGGGTKTGHAGSEAAVPGTGGGSTSIRLLTDSLYSRVIVAGGGASGDQGALDHCGFGGGMSGGSSYCCGRRPLDPGAGTQTGSSPGPKGSGVAGTFGQGATGLCMQGRNSGGGGWYGGGSGGYSGECSCASGGGGSSMAAWRSGDRSKCDKFALDRSFYLSDASTEAGNTSFPAPSGSSETGHRGDGYAKIW